MSRSYHKLADQIGELEYVLAVNCVEGNLAKTKEDLLDILVTVNNTATLDRAIREHRRAPGAKLPLACAPELEMDEESGIARRADRDRRQGVHAIVATGPRSPRINRGFRSFRR